MARYEYSARLGLNNYVILLMTRQQCEKELAKLTHSSIVENIERITFLEGRIKQLSERMDRQERCFDFMIELTAEQLHAFTGGYKDEEHLIREDEL